MSDIQEYYIGTNPYDADHDGLGDLWELTFMGNLSVVNDPSGNPDNDYLNNHEEWLRGLNPLASDAQLPLNGAYRGTVILDRQVKE